MSSLGLLAETTGKNITEIMEPHKDVLQDMIPPKKHLLRHQPLNAQIGLMVMYFLWPDSELATQKNIFVT